MGLNKEQMEAMNRVSLGAGGPPAGARRPTQLSLAPQAAAAEPSPTPSTPADSGPARLDNSFRNALVPSLTCLPSSPRCMRNLDTSQIHLLILIYDLTSEFASLRALMEGVSVSSLKKNKNLPATFIQISKLEI